ncbi:MAG: nitroreductase family deazaflavin-dependent oxidoreductase [Gammaproteobacteria bacterium]|nr:nitroreductase family deazaflavin-dependent oxidoreductase [Gammaproteobacteria bacterium]
MFERDELREFNKSIIEEFRSNEGVVGGMFEGEPLLLLTSTGAKSGLLRTNPVTYLADGDRYIIFASYEGQPTNPPWYYNLKSNPDVSIEVGSDKFNVKAIEVEDPERSELFAKVAERMPDFKEYEKRTTRVIPVIALTRS